VTATEHARRACCAKLLLLHPLHLSRSPLAQEIMVKIRPRQEKIDEKLKERRGLQASLQPDQAVRLWPAGASC
jgi:hypothetical protein